jgi:hypothetical protein
VDCFGAIWDGVLYPPGDPIYYGAEEGMKRDVFSCDICENDIMGTVYNVTAFGAERHLCAEHAEELEYWIKPMMARMQNKKATIVLSDAPQ